MAGVAQETGTSERFAKQLKAELTSRYREGTQFDVLDIEDYRAEQCLAGEQLVFFLMATYGDGEPTDNAAEFYSWLTKAAQRAEGEEGEKLLEGVSFGVFGLGNKQYEHFCAVGKRVHKALTQLGATPVVRRGDGDDDEDIEADFELWRTDLYASLDKSALVSNQEGRDAATLVLAVDKVASYEESDRCCVHVELDISGTGLSYEAGDHVGIHAQNSAAVVEQMADLLGLPLDTVFRLTVPEGNPGELSTPFAGPTTLRTALAWHADVLSPAHKPALQALAAFGGEGLEAARLRHLVSPAGKEEYQEWVASCNRSLLEVMAAFPSVKPSLGAFFGCIAPRLQVRFYSISSSPLQHPTSIHVTCAVIRETTPTGRLHEGVASRMLQQARVGQELPIFVRRSSFKLPASPATPLIMVGPGTGLAPFRGFLQERAALAAAGTTLGPAHLFFGCRQRACDFIYQDELEHFVRCGALTRLHLAFSRDSAQKDYVQHHLERSAADTWALISQAGGHIYVCGDAKAMARDVHRSLLTIAQQQKQAGSEEDAEQFIKQLADAGRYQRDVW
ncbi:hypothetical protein WJX72_012296 [[Myrmecia] bisecta]|uniref:NADPH--hemoprotein reductase n=1 Tax=[Myrmecia] bisecta TaxID=41462 RepID=A0AAW1PU56_9CHLO